MKHKDLFVFLAVIGLIIGGLTWYHLATPSPYTSEVFFGQ
jgi:tellurite resistance protein TehA-like permease